jgi:hypothetical protein
MVATAGFLQRRFPPGERDDARRRRANEVLVDAHAKGHGGDQGGRRGAGRPHPGHVRRPGAAGRGGRPAERRAGWEDPYLAAARGDDFIGVQTYTRHRFGPDGMVDPAPGVPLTMMAYELWPEALGATIRRAAEITGAPVLSILNRGSGADIGALMLSYGGGHANAGTCQVPHDQADRVVDPQAPPSRVVTSPTGPR